MLSTWIEQNTLNDGSVKNEIAVYGSAAVVYVGKVHDIHFTFQPISRVFSGCRYGRLFFYAATVSLGLIPG